MAIAARAPLTAVLVSLLRQTKSLAEMGKGVRKVVAVRLSADELAVLDAMVRDEKAKVANWWESQPSRSSVIREAIVQRNTADPKRITKRSRER